jgi:hypothetical protein|tara:strand:- start:1117 stop:1317 length:201 start_codon:yes stop_codon:yes gene_type:complete
MKKVIISDKEYQWDNLTDEVKQLVQSIQSIEIEVNREKQLLASLNQARILLTAELKRSILKKKSGI